MTQPLASCRTPASAPDPRLEQALRSVMLAAVSLVMLMPAARGYGPLGWTPVWLLGLPAVAWWALHRFRLPWPARASGAVQVPRRRRIAVPVRSRRVLPVRRLAGAA